MAKYDSLRKTKRNQAIIKFHLDNPDLSQKEIAEYFNLSKQRISSILKKVATPRDKRGYLWDYLKKQRLIE